MTEDLNAKNDSKLNHIVGDEAKAVGDEYKKLLVAETLSDDEEARMLDILELALTNEEVDFWIAHITDAQAIEKGMVSDSEKKRYEDQKALLREQLGNPLLPHSRGTVEGPVDAPISQTLNAKMMYFFG